MKNNLPQCEHFLPSAQSADNFIHGRKGSLYEVSRDLIGRGFLIGLGLSVFTKEETPFRDGMIGASFIEAFVLASAWFAKK
jgi:hypothetical protein